MPRMTNYEALVSAAGTYGAIAAGSAYGAKTALENGDIAVATYFGSNAALFGTVSLTAIGALYLEGEQNQIEDQKDL